MPSESISRESSRRAWIHPSEMCWQDENKPFLMASTFLRARPSTLEELRADLDVLCMLGSADKRLITDDQQQVMAAFAQHLSGSDVPDTTFQLHPFSEVAIMIHWRVLIAARMNERQRAHWKEVYGHGGQGELVQDKPSVGPKTFDAHFHLDRTTELAGLPARHLWNKSLDMHKQKAWYGLGVKWSSSAPALHSVTQTHTQQWRISIAFPATWL
ncbi:hypothetical protein ACOMHN_033045 [Nucella lapillus]